MRDISESTVCNNSNLQYSIESLDEFRSTAYQCGLQAIEKAGSGNLTPIYFNSGLVGAGFDLTGSATTVGSTQNYYKIKNSFGKI